jgi:hypothetical protein
MADTMARTTSQRLRTRHPSPMEFRLAGGSSCERERYWPDPRVYCMKPSDTEMPGLANANRLTRPDHGLARLPRSPVPCPSSARRMKRCRVMTAGLVVLAMMAACSSDRADRQVPIPASLNALLALSPDKLEKMNIARVNQLCAEGLTESPAERMDEPLVQLDGWAERVRAETRRHRYRFERNPAEFEGSEGFFGMLMLGVVLAEDYGVHYHSDWRTGVELATDADGFFARAEHVFLSGLLGPERRGTCSSMPVLYVAVGRRLGYPLKLVTTKGHLFVRWEGAGERFNLEVTGDGLNRYADEYYRHWPFEVSEEEIEAEGYLKSLDAAGELAVFLSIRGMCLREAERWNEAQEAFQSASRLAPAVSGYQMMAEHCGEMARAQQREMTLTGG